MTRIAGKSPCDRVPPHHSPAMFAGQPPRLENKVFAAAIIFALGALAQSQFGTAAEAKAMLEKAVAALKSDEAGAIAKFNSGEGGFRDRDLYVFCYDMPTGNFTAHVNKASLGTDIRALKQKDGYPLGEKVYSATQAGTISTVSYEFPKPGTTDPVPKESYVTRVGNQGCGVGYYK